MQYTNIYSSPIGNLVMVSDGENLTGLWFEGEKYLQEALDKTEYIRQDFPVFELTGQWLDCYFLGKDPGFMPPLHLEGSAFRMAVWEILKQISYGKLMTYGEIAEIIAQQRGLEKMSAQAVGGAVGHNPVSIIVPCHRVVGTNGSLTGYAGGIDKKVALLNLEHVDMEHLFVPKKGTAL